MSEETIQLASDIPTEAPLVDSVEAIADRANANIETLKKMKDTTDKSYQELNKEFSDMMEHYQLVPSIVENLFTSMTMSQIETMSEEYVDTAITVCSTSYGASRLEAIAIDWGLKNPMRVDDDLVAKPYECVRLLFKDIKTLLSQIEGERAKLESISKDLRELEAEILGEFYSVKRTNEIIKSFESNIEHIAECIDLTESDIERRKLQKEMDDLSISISILKMDFFQIIPGNSVDQLISAYFDKTKNKYTYDRFQKVLEILNISPSSFQLFSNIEERFLEELYHPFNNFYLFHIIRTIAFMDTKDSDKTTLRIRLIIQSLIAFVNHPEETYVKQQILFFYTKFMDKRDLFVEKNPLYSENAKNGIDREILDTVHQQHLAKIVNYLERMLLLEGSATSEAELNRFVRRSSYKEIERMMDVIHTLIKAKMFDHTTFTLAFGKTVVVEEVQKEMVDNLIKDIEKSTDTAKESLGEPEETKTEIVESEEE